MTEPERVFKPELTIWDLDPETQANIKAGKGQMGMLPDGTIIANKANGGLCGWTNEDLKNLSGWGVSGYYGQDPAYNSYATNIHLA